MTLTPHSSLRSSALFTKAQLQRGQNLLITGIGGGVALIALQFAVAAGANVWVTSSSEEKLAKAKELGAKGGVSYKDGGWSNFSLCSPAWTHVTDV